MDNNRHFIARLMDASAFAPQSLPNQPVIEVLGTRRVLIENHCGVKEYQHEKIVVQMGFGCVYVTGCNLELIRMTKEQLVICGTIHSIQLPKKEAP